MDTEKLFILNEETSEISYAELSENDLLSSKHYVEITRHLQEIHQLFLITKYNISCLQERYLLMNSGDVYYDGKAADSENDFIAINAHITSIISSGKTLADAMECYINTNSDIEKTFKDEYLNYYHHIYDSSFAYRFLIRLRDFSQHGHLPVSSERNNYYFDLKQIAEKPHFNHNQALLEQMSHAIDEIIDVYKDTPMLCLTKTVAEFVAKLFTIYNKFWKCTESELISSYLKFQSIIKTYPENIITASSFLNGLFVYDVENGMAQTVHTKDNPQKMFKKFKSEANAVYNEYRDAFEQLIQNTLWIRCVDKERIEIGVGTLSE